MRWTRPSPWRRTRSSPVLGANNIANESTRQRPAAAHQQKAFPQILDDSKDSSPFLVLDFEDPRLSGARTLSSARVSGINNYPVQRKPRSRHDTLVQFQKRRGKCLSWP